MADKVTVASPLPGLAKGDVLTKDQDGRYRNNDGSYWGDGAFIEANPETYLPDIVPPEDIPDAAVLYTVEGDGTVSRSISDGKPPTILPRNVFLTAKEADVLAEKYLEILNVAVSVAKDIG